MESQSKVLADLLAAISAMNAKLDDMHPIVLELNKCCPGVERAVDVLPVEVGELRPRVVAMIPAEPTVSPLLLLSAEAPSSSSKPASPSKPASAVVATSCVDAMSSTIVVEGPKPKAAVRLGAKYGLHFSATTGAATTSVATAVSASTTSPPTSSLVCPISSTSTSSTPPSTLKAAQEVFESMSEPFRPSQDAAATVKEQKEARESASTLVIHPSTWYQQFLVPCVSCSVSLHIQMVCEKQRRAVTCEVRQSWPLHVQANFSDWCSIGQLDTDDTVPLFLWNPVGYFSGSRNRMNMVFLATTRRSHWLVPSVCDGPTMISPFAVVCDEWVLPPWDSGQQADVSYDQFSCANRYTSCLPGYFLTGGQMQVSDAASLPATCLSKCPSNDASMSAIEAALIPSATLTWSMALEAVPPTAPTPPPTPLEEDHQPPWPPPQLDVVYQPDYNPCVEKRQCTWNPRELFSIERKPRTVQPMRKSMVLESFAVPSVVKRVMLCKNAEEDLTYKLSDKLLQHDKARLGMYGLELNICTYRIERLLSCVPMFAPEGVNCFQDPFVYSQIAWWLYDRQSDIFCLVQLVTETSSHGTPKQNTPGYAGTLDCFLEISSLAISGCVGLLLSWTEAMVRYLLCSFSILAWFSAECAFFSVPGHFHWAKAKLYNAPILHWEISWLFDLKYFKGGNMFRKPFSVDILPEHYHWQIAWSSLVLVLYSIVVMRRKTPASSSHQLRLTVHQFRLAVQWKIVCSSYLYLGGSVNSYKSKEFENDTMLGPASEMTSDRQPSARQDKASISLSELDASVLYMTMMEAFKIGESVLLLVHGYWSGISGCLQWDPGGICDAPTELSWRQAESQEGENVICLGCEGCFASYSNRSEQLEGSPCTSWEGTYGVHFLMCSHRWKVASTRTTRTRYGRVSFLQVIKLTIHCVRGDMLGLNFDEVRTTWVPDTFFCIGLRASRFLRREECYDPRLAYLKLGLCHGPSARGSAQPTARS